MATITYDNRRFTMLPTESVLDTLLRNDVEIAHSCRSGACRSCMMVASSGPVPEAAQVNLREVERRQGMLLACLCRPDADLELRSLGDAGSVSARVIEVARLTDSVVRLRLHPHEPLDYEPGQYVSLRRTDGLTRSYSLASVTSEPWLELHIRRVADGRLSRWAYDELEAGEDVTLRGPYGSCCYVAEQPDAPLLLVAVGTGLAPLWGVVRHAIACDHRGPITLIQAAAQPSGLYMREQLRGLADAHPRVHVRTCVLHGAGDEIEIGSVDVLAVDHLREAGNIGDHLAFVCGDAAVVHKVRRGLFMAGLSSRRIFADAFVQAPASTS